MAPLESAIGGGRPSQSIWAFALRRLVRNRLAMFGLVVIVTLLIIALFAPLIATYDPAKQNYDVISQGPSGSHWFGTDHLGRDVYSRVVFGARTALAVGIFAQAIVIAIGIPVGAMAGYFGGRIDNWLMRFVDVVFAFPDLLFIILLRAILGGGIMMIFLAIGLYSWVHIARLVRAQVLSAKSTDYVLAAQAMGARKRAIFVRHLLPNIIGPVIVLVAFSVPRAIFVEAALSYIGIGIRPPTPSWGTMLQDGYNFIFVAPHLVVFPAIAIAVIMLVFTFLGDGLRDALDPRLERK